jgi:RecB family endonuclease NucS
VRLLEKKYYKYINNNPKVTEIRIHLNEISGLTRIRAKRTGILEEGGNEISMEKEIPNTIVVKERVTSPIYLEVHGIVTSLYTISVSAIHPEHVTSNALVMAEDVEY